MLGLLLFLISFAGKQMMVSYGILRSNAQTEVARVDVAHRAAVNELRSKERLLRMRIDQMRTDEDATRELINKKDAELQEMTKENRKKIEDIEADHGIDSMKASRKAGNSAATSLRMLKLAWWIKLLLDAAKVAGCFFVVFAAFNIVCDKDEDSAVKIFATVCTGVVLTAIVALSILTVMM